MLTEILIEGRIMGDSSCHLNIFRFSRVCIAFVIWKEEKQMHIFKIYSHNKAESLKHDKWHLFHLPFHFHLPQLLITCPMLLQQHRLSWPSLNWTLCSHKSMPFYMLFLLPPTPKETTTHEKLSSLGRGPENLQDN